MKIILSCSDPLVREVFNGWKDCTGKCVDCVSRVELYEIDFGKSWQIIQAPVAVILTILYPEYLPEIASSF